MFTLFRTKPETIPLSQTSKMHEPFVIGICGPSCSGKTTASKKIQEELEKNGEENVILVSQDQYYKGGNAQTNYDMPMAIDFELMTEQLKELKAGKTVKAPEYDFATHSRKDETIEIKSAPIIIVEGILIYCYPELLELFDLKVFVQARPELYFQRRVARDVVERGRLQDDVIKRYMEHVAPANELYVMPSSRYADVILQNNIEHQFIGLEVMISYIGMKLEEKLK